MEMCFERTRCRQRAEFVILSFHFISFHFISFQYKLLLNQEVIQSSEKRQPRLGQQESSHDMLARLLAFLFAYLPACLLYLLTFFICLWDYLSLNCTKPHFISPGRPGSCLVSLQGIRSCSDAL